MSVRKNFIAPESYSDTAQDNRRTFGPRPSQLSPHASGFLDRAIRRALSTDTKPAVGKSAGFLAGDKIDGFLDRLHRELFSRWAEPGMDSVQRRNSTYAIVQQALDAHGVPAVDFGRPALRGDLHSEFSSHAWTMQFDNAYFLLPTLSRLEEIHVANTIAHECAHAVNNWRGICAMVQNEGMTAESYDQKQLARWFPRRVFERALLGDARCDSDELEQGLDFANRHFFSRSRKRRQRDAKDELKAIEEFEKAVDNTEKLFRHKKDSRAAMAVAVQAFEKIFSLHDPSIHVEINAMEKRMTAAYLRRLGLKIDDVTPLFSHWPLFQLAFSPEFRDRIPAPLTG